MDDELEDEVLHQTLLSHVSLLTRFLTFSVNNNTLALLGRHLRFYLLKPEALVVGLAVVILFLVCQSAEFWCKTVLGKVTSGGRPLVSGGRLLLGNVGQSFSDDTKKTWQLQQGSARVYAIQGRRPRMEDRFSVLIDEDTGISLYGIYDGHGGESAAEFVERSLFKTLLKRLQLAKSQSNQKQADGSGSDSSPSPPLSKSASSASVPKSTFSPINIFKSSSSACVSKSPSSSSVSKPTNSKDSCTQNDGAGGSEEKKSKPTDETQSSCSRAAHQNTRRLPFSLTSHFAKLLTEEILAVDKRLLSLAKQANDAAGTTALVAIVYEGQLIVANVGDSRGVICDSKGNTIPLSFDHKPQQIKEHRRIKEAGGFITFNGVWRVAGILATSRALGDFPLKDRNLIIAEPDILTFDLKDMKAQFMILASDGLWDEFSNEEAVAFVRENMDDPFLGAKKLAIEAYSKGSVDNITILIVDLRNFSGVGVKREE